MSDRTIGIILVLTVAFAVFTFWLGWMSGYAQGGFDAQPYQPAPVLPTGEVLLP